jgi:chemotaxis family two-component system sensor kinase Cph1
MSSKRGGDTELLLAGCASEPIRIPGFIQPHGYLLAFDGKSCIPQQVSANVPGLLGQGVTEILGRAPEDWLAPSEAHALRGLIEKADELASESESLLTLNGTSLAASVHRIDSLTIVELERPAASRVDSEPILARVLRRLQSATGLQALHEVTVREIRELTGCDRVVVYAFDAQGHGKVLAEARSDDVAPYLGLNFPASDIPAQARDLYKLNWLRMIPDVDYEPVPIVGLQTAASGAPLDLTYAMLRSVSPVHREYMRHMGAGSSMSISLIRDGELWGLISCVHGTPKLLSRDVRSACLSIGRLLSLQISALEGLRESKLVEANQGLLLPLVTAMHGSGRDVLTSLLDEPEALLRLVDSTGAAILVGTELHLVGVCPSEQEVLGLSRHVIEHAVSVGHFASANLAAVHPEAAALADVASGVLAIILPKPAPSMVLWFRPEVTRTVAWAGDPAKLPSTEVAGSTGGAALRLSPRSSFDAWKILLSNHAVEWSPHQIAAARELRRFAIELDLADQVGCAQQAVASRDELVAVVSHDLRSPLSVVALQAVMLVRTLLSETSPSSKRMLAAGQSIQRATSRMSDMLRDLLDLTTIEQGRYSVDLKPHRVEEIFEDAEALLLPIAEPKRIALSFRMEPDLVVDADVERLYQVISNLVGNALKFTAEGGSVEVVAQSDRGSDGRLVRFAVSDTGAGMSEEQLAHVFERYWHVREANASGSGLGLYIARGIVAAHAGTIWAESQPGVGSTFYFTIPSTLFPLPVDARAE